MLGGVVQVQSCEEPTLESVYCEVFKTLNIIPNIQDIVKSLFINKTYTYGPTPIT